MAQATLAKPRKIVYPDSDGEPMADNTVQYRWIVMLHANIDWMYADREDVFVAADHLIYPVEGEPSIRSAPDVYVAFGRPKKDRGSYQVWLEDGIFPQVVFEVLSPGNRKGKMQKKFDFYEEYGAKEYYIYDPDRFKLQIFVRKRDKLVAVKPVHGFKSPLMGITFSFSTGALIVNYPNGRSFMTVPELQRQHAYEKAMAELERRRTEEMRQLAEMKSRQFEEEKRRNEEQQRLIERATAAVSLAESETQRMRAKLRSLGIDPDADVGAKQ